MTNPAKIIDSEGKQMMENEQATYAGWIYHLGINSKGNEYCHARYLVVRGKFCEMYMYDPDTKHGEKPMRKGAVGPHLIVAEIGRQMFHDKVLYVMKLCGHADDNKQVQFACLSAAELEKWIYAFRRAKDEAESDIIKRSRGRMPASEKDQQIPQSRSGSIVTIGKGPESLLRQSTVFAQDDDYPDGDAVEQADWRCFAVINGLRILEDVAASKAKKGTIMKSVGVVDASPDAVFETIMSLDSSERYKWDVLTGNLELVEHIDGHADVVYGTFDSAYVKRRHWYNWHPKKRDFVISRYWRRDQDGSYAVTHISITHKSRPIRRGHRRVNLNSGIWEITPIPSVHGSNCPRTRVTQVIELETAGWGGWKKGNYSQFNKTVPCILLCRTAGLREYFRAEFEAGFFEAQVSQVKTPKEAAQLATLEVSDTTSDFYEAILAEDPDGGNYGLSICLPAKRGSRRESQIAWSRMLGISDKRLSGFLLEDPIKVIDLNAFSGTLRRSMNEKDNDCWADPGGDGFMVRGATYIKDNIKIPGSSPVLKLLAVDWLKSDVKIELIGKEPTCLVQKEAAKKLPFILVINLQVPAKPNYSLIFYYGADRPIRNGSLLEKFIVGDDCFRNSCFKLIPSIVEGYWVVRRAVGTKACLLGRAVSCHYFRQDNFLEIDVDIGSSAVARNVIGLVLGYVTKIVVDLGILIEAKQEDELPEYILGAARITRIEPNSAVAFVPANRAQT